MYYFVVSNNVVSGEVEGKQGNELFLLGNESYELSSSLTGVKSSYISTVDYGKITLYLDVDEAICTMYEYFDIFLQRMLLSRGAAEMLGAKFSLRVNNSRVL